MPRVMNMINGSGAVVGKMMATLDQLGELAARIVQLEATL